MPYIPQIPNQKTPQRSLAEYTVGNPDFKIDLSSAASSPNISSLTTNPAVFQTVGIDSQVVNLPTHAVAANSWGLLASGIVTLPNMPGSLTFGPNDRAFLMAYMHVLSCLQNAVGAQVLYPQAFAAGITYQGPLMPNNVTLTSFAVSIAVYGIPQFAWAAGSGYQVRVDAVLYDLPG